MSKKSLTIYTPAKLNLYLEVCNKMLDGYHSIKTVFQSIDLFDTLTFEGNFMYQAPFKGSKSNSQIKTQLESAGNYSKNLPVTDKNIIYKAAKLFTQEAKISVLDLKIKLQKNIPIAAGLAGGSTNAAGVLYALNYLLGEPLKHEQLVLIARNIGADVPFCLLGGRMVGTGRGDQLMRFPINEEMLFLLVLPPEDVQLSTADVYKKYSTQPTLLHRPKVNFEGFVSSLNQKDNLEEISQSMFNSLEEPAIQMNYWVDQVLTAINSKGFNAILSGSGPTVFSLIPNEQDALNLRMLLKEEGFNAVLHRSVDIPHFQVFS